VFTAVSLRVPLREERDRRERDCKQLNSTLVPAVCGFGYAASDIKVICDVEKMWEKIFKTCFKAQKQHLSGGCGKTNDSLDTLSLSRDFKKGILKAGTLLTVSVLSMVLHLVT